MAAQEDPDISVLFEDSLPAPGTTGAATFTVENLSDADASFEGAIRLDDDPARVLACESAEAPPHADTEVTCTVESTADACDQVMDLFMSYTWSGRVDVTTTANGDFDVLGRVRQVLPVPDQIVPARGFPLVSPRRDRFS